MKKYARQIMKHYLRVDLLSYFWYFSREWSI